MSLRHMEIYIYVYLVYIYLYLVYISLYIFGLSLSLSLSGICTKIGPSYSRNMMAVTRAFSMAPWLY